MLLECVDKWQSRINPPAVQNTGQPSALQYFEIDTHPLLHLSITSQTWHLVEQLEGLCFQEAWHRLLIASNILIKCPRTAVVFNKLTIFGSRQSACKIIQNQLSHIWKISHQILHQGDALLFQLYHQLLTRLWVQIDPYILIVWQTKDVANDILEACLATLYLPSSTVVCLLQYISAWYPLPLEVYHIICKRPKVQTVHLRVDMVEASRFPIVKYVRLDLK